MVCSNWAAELPSAVTVVQLSGHVMPSMLPMVRIGSAVKVKEFKIKKKIPSLFYTLRKQAI